MKIRNKNVFALFILLAVLSAFKISYAQKKEEAAANNYFWGTLGVGIGAKTDENSLPLAFNLNFTYRHNLNLFSFRLTSVGVLFDRTLNDYGLLYGYTLTSSALFTSIGAGVALVSGTKSNGVFGKTENLGTNIGLPLEARLFWHPIVPFGLGLYFFADINPKKTFEGITLSIQIGKLR
jgi:hypothetical protein